VVSGIDEVGTEGKRAAALEPLLVGLSVRLALRVIRRRIAPDYETARIDGAEGRDLGPCFFVNGQVAPAQDDTLGSTQPVMGRPVLELDVNGDVSEQSVILLCIERLNHEASVV